MMSPELVLHVGLQQTGATRLHRSLASLRPQLHRHGVGLVGHPALSKLAVEGWRCDERVDPAAVEAFEIGVAGLVAGQIAAIRRAGAAPRTIVISSDHLLGRRNLDARDERLFRPHAVASIVQVIRAIGPSRTRLVLYVRRQDRLMEACYLRALGQGRTHGFDQQFPHRFEPVLDHLALIERLETILEVERVWVRPFELVGASATTHVRDLLGAVGVGGRLNLGPVPADRPPYRLYAPRAASIALDVNPYLESPRDRRLVHDFLTSQVPGTDDASTRLLARRERDRILAAYAAANRRLFERCMPDLPPDAYASDDDTARLAASGTAPSIAVASTPSGQPAAHVAEPHVDEVTFPIDVVYTWVDGADPRWRAKKQAALQGMDPDAYATDAADPSRFHSHDELRYSLRSVVENAEFVRHIFVVTDGQVPSWLATDHDRVTIVDHREIFPDASYLPTFNSHAIESRLHHIPGLAEHYLYFNDDFFLTRPVAADKFFHANGMTKFFPSPALIDDTVPATELRSVDAAAANTRRLISARFGRQVQHKLKHTPYPQRRSVLYELEDATREQFDRTAGSRVRSHDDIAIPSSLYHYYAYLTGRAVPGRISSLYVSLGERNLHRRLRALKRRRNRDVLCINDAVDAHTGGHAWRSRRLQRFMAAYWPTASPFER
jgi:hypothetical protein